MASAGLSKKRAFVTGGGGYLGSKLCEELTSLGYTVTAFDVFFVNDSDTPGITKLKGNVCDADSVVSAISSSHADVVFHLASFGMSGREMMEKKKIEAVNIGGTHNIINGCIECGVTRLVYTSTYNVVFGGQEIREGDESLPYLPLHKHVDNYSRTKSVADKAVLEANGREVKNSDGHLSTCALRCAGIYGEGEQRHFPRIVKYIERGLFSFTYGAKDNLVDFLHADNFVQAHIKAAEALLSSESPAAGKPYFISDGRPVNNFLFLKPLVEGLGYTYPRMRVPLGPVFFIAYLIECIHHLVSPLYNFQPLLTRAEVFKTGVTHYFSIAAARRDLGYDPQPKNLSGIVKWFRERSHGRKVKHNRTCSRWLVPVLLLVLVWVLLLGTLPIVY